MSSGEHYHEGEWPEIPMKFQGCSVCGAPRRKGGRYCPRHHAEYMKKVRLRAKHEATAK
jgi:predicted nucleic acid-binding Zn ribbon protein